MAWQMPGNRLPLDFMPALEGLPPIGEDSLTAALMDLKNVTAGELAAANRKPHKSQPNAPPTATSGSLSRSSDSPSSGSFPGARSYVTPEDIATAAARSVELIEAEDWAEALKAVVEEHDLTCRAYGNMDGRTLQALSTYAGVLWQLGRGTDARELLEELVDKRSQAVANFDPSAAKADEVAEARSLLADALVELATVLAELEEPSLAVPLLQQALAIREAALGTFSEQSLGIYDQLARALAGGGMGEAAVDALRKSLKVKRAMYGAVSLEVADGHNELAVALQVRARFAATPRLRAQAPPAHARRAGAARSCAPRRRRRCFREEAPALTPPEHGALC